MTIISHRSMVRTPRQKDHTAKKWLTFSSALNWVDVVTEPYHCEVVGQALRGLLHHILGHFDFFGFILRLGCDRMLEL